MIYVYMCVCMVQKMQNMGMLYARNKCNLHNNIMLSWCGDVRPLRGLIVIGVG